MVCLTLYIINKNYQRILTFGQRKYLLPSKLLFFFYTCMFHYFFLIYISYLCIDVILIFFVFIMKQSINIRCTQHFLYFESHKKSLKLLHIIVCFSVLSISSAFTISTYFIKIKTLINYCVHVCCTKVKKTNIYLLHVIF
jgi:hypothetical protein